MPRKYMANWTDSVLEALEFKAKIIAGKIGVVLGRRLVDFSIGFQVVSTHHLHISACICRVQRKPL